MFTLFLSGTLLDNITAVSLEIIQKPDGTYHNLTMMFFLLLYILISSFTILNMLIGVLCEVVKIVPMTIFRLGERGSGHEKC